jgi:TPR repeat protein
VLNPAAGTYAQPQSVTITDATPNAVIHFTIDGKPPTEASPIYSFLPISSLPSGSVVRAMATATGHRPSADITGVYTWSGAAQPAVKPVGTTSARANSDYDQGKTAFDHKDYAKARTLFTQACDGNNMNACNYLGYIFDQGLGVPANDVEAGKVYQKACDQGNLRGCTGLGSVFQNLGNVTEARRYFQKACEGKLAEACDLLRATQ